MPSYVEITLVSPIAEFALEQWTANLHMKSFSMMLLIPVMFSLMDFWFKITYVMYTFAGNKIRYQGSEMKIHIKDNQMFPIIPK
jgi:hypothetical protein